MCYSQSMSALFALIGLLMSIVAYKYKQHNIGLWILISFYTFMELIQTLQYSVVNRCDHPFNILLTEIAYVLVIVQPLMWNVYYYTNNKSDSVFKVGISMALIWMFINLYSRVAYTHYNAIEPEYSVYASYCVCTMMRTSHLFWKWTSKNLGDLTPNMLNYLMIWFIPALFSSKHLFPHIIIIASACVGAFMAYVAGEKEIFTSAWCYISIPTMLIFLISLLNK